MSQPVIHNPRIETLDRDDLTQLQIERLQSTLNRACRNVAFYRAAFAARRVDPEKMKDLRALRDLPFTTREDLRRSYPYDMFAVPLRDIVRMHSTLGTTGRPIVVGYTRNDLRNWTECTARLLAAAGLTEHDVVQIALDYGLFAGGFGFQHGAEQIGASVIPTSLTAGTDRQIIIMRDFRTTVLVTTPSYALSLASAIEQACISPAQLRLRLALIGGEQWSDGLRQQLEERLRVACSDVYGLTEVMGPGVAGECHMRCGLHINEDQFIAEIIDPKTLQPLEEGTPGELVLTTITKEGFPLIRYRTGDITSLTSDPCGCGRTLARMARVTGRTDDLILFRGVGFFPSQIEQIVADVEHISPHFQIILGREGGADTLEIKVEVSEKIPSLDELKTLESLRQQLVQHIKAALDIDARVTFVEPRSLRQAAGGRGRVVDNRSA